MRSAIVIGTAAGSSMSESRQRIIDAANELFQGGSFQVVGIAEICGRARVNKGTFYHFFPSKIALLIELLDLFVKGVLAEYEAVTRQAVAPADKMRLIFQIPKCRNATWKSQYGMAAGCFIGNMCLELASNEPAVREKTEWAFKTLSKGLEPIIADMLAESGRPVSEAPAQAEIVMGLMQGAQVMAKAKNDPDLFTGYSELVVQMFKPAAARRSRSTAASL